MVDLGSERADTAGHGHLLRTSRRVRLISVVPQLGPSPPKPGLYPTHRTLGAAGTITPSEAFGQVPVFASGGKERNGLFTLQTRLTSDRFSPADAHRQWTTGQRADPGPTQGPPSAPRAWPGLERTLIPQTLSEEL